MLDCLESAARVTVLARHVGWCKQLTCRNNDNTLHTRQPVLGACSSFQVSVPTPHLLTCTAEGHSAFQCPSMLYCDGWLLRTKVSQLIHTGQCMCTLAGQVCTQVSLRWLDCNMIEQCIWCNSVQQPPCVCGTDRPLVVAVQQLLQVMSNRTRKPYAFGCFAWRILV